jgi:hypothetical protein
MPSSTLRSRLAATGVAGTVLAGSLLVASSAQAARSTAMSASWTDTSVTIGAAVSVRGRVSPSRTARTVVLQRRTRVGWAPVKTGRTRGGDYSFRVSTLLPGEDRYRVRVTASPTATAATSAARTVRVTRPRARGNPSAYSFLGRDGTAIARWNPCQPIGYRVNARLGGRGALTDVKAAVARIRRITGLRFAYRGSTRIVPGGANDGAYPSDTDLVVAWARPAQTQYFGLSGIAGMGGSDWVPAVNRRGDWDLMITRGFAVLNANYDIAGGFGTGAGYPSQWAGTRGQLLMHEIGHAVGMGHAAGDRWEILYPTMTEKRAVWGAGDLRGLTRLGAAQGCLSTNRSLASVAGSTPWSEYLP